VGFFQAVLGGAISLIVYAMIMAGVYKLFKISSDLTEIKGLLADIKRNGEMDRPPYPTPPSQAQIAQAAWSVTAGRRPGEN
jgi:hypothetical protein